MRKALEMYLYKSSAFLFIIFTNSQKVKNSSLLSKFLFVTHLFFTLGLKL